MQNSVIPVKLESIDALASYSRAPNRAATLDMACMSPTIAASDKAPSLTQCQLDDATPSQTSQ
jgi:hypothetical protein